MEKNVFDVVIVGFGPVGQALSIALARKGHTVAVVERWPEVYALPRAVCYDHEIRRMLQALGLHDAIDPISRQGCKYQWFNADWKLLVEFDWMEESISGGPAGYFFNQPQLEEALSRAAKSLPSATIFQGWEATAATQDADNCTVTIARRSHQLDAGGETRTLTARYVVGADGANSLVRTAAGIEWNDLGFREDWLVVDVEPNPGVKVDVPDFAQWCNPARPTTMVPGGPLLRRWEFMRLPGESVEELQSEEKVWELLSPWIGPGQAKLTRHTVYRFQSLVASRWRVGRFLLAGDAAHLMPPFMGQGMCTGLRDAWNLTWKLDMVLNNNASDEILDWYMPERENQVEAVINASIVMGKVVCVADPAQAARRDEAFFTGAVAKPDPFPGLRGGLIVTDSEGRAGKLAGTLGPHAQLVQDGNEGRFDDLVQQGFQVLTFNPGLVQSLDEAQQDMLARIGASIITLTRKAHLEQAEPADLVDIEGKFEQYFSTHRIEILLMRPDFYVFGAADDAGQFNALLECLYRQLFQHDAAPPAAGPLSGLPLEESATRHAHRPVPNLTAELQPG